MKNNKCSKIIALFMSLSIICSYFIVDDSVGLADTQDNKIVIYHTNDMHGRVNSEYNNGALTQIGLDVVKTAKDSTKNSILIDAGDATQGVPMGKFSKGISIIDLMNETGYDGMTVGNHEFDYGADAVKKIAQTADFPVVSANILYNGETFLKDINNSNGCYFIKEVAGKKIGFFGITTEETMRTTIPANLEGISFADEIETSREQVQALKNNNVDIIVGIMHIGIDSSSKVTSHQIAQAVDGIDIIIDGHSHTKTTEKVGNTLVQQTGVNGSNLGEIDITFNGDSFDIQGRLISPSELGSKFAADESVTKVYDKFADEIAPTLEKVVGKSENTLYGGSYNGKNVSRMVETNLGSLIGDAMIYAGKDLLKETEYDNMPTVAMENGGAVRSKINAGFVTMEDVLEVLPLDNRICMQVITPDILYQTMERGVCKLYNPSVEGGPLDGFFGGYPQIAGMRIEYDINKTPYDTNNPKNMIGDRVTKIILLNEDGTDGKELDRNDSTTQIAFLCNDYTVTEYPMISDIPIAKKGDYLSNVLADYINKLTLENNGSFSYPLIQDRSKLLKQEDLFGNYDSKVTVSLESNVVPGTNLKYQVDDGALVEAVTDENGVFTVQNLSSGGHNIKVFINNLYADGYVDETVGLEDTKINVALNSDKNVSCTINVIDQLAQDSSNVRLVNFARQSYNSLNDSDKSKISNYNLLVSAENSLNMNNGVQSNSLNMKLVVCIIAIILVVVLILLFVFINHRKKSKYDNKVTRR